MRIIAGKFRGRKLKSPPSLQTRPTSDRLRETLFNILAPRIESCRFLDLCAGTGAVGIEALSRGASHVTFVDQSRKMSSLIETNLKSLGILESGYQIVVPDALGYLHRHLKKGSLPFDIVFFDPPYATDYEALLNFSGDQARQILNAEGIVIVEHYKKKLLANQFAALTRYRELNQGDSVLSFYKLED
jgi:16S rRNA (guanine966-N2)-methyltransferase